MTPLPLLPLVRSVASLAWSKATEKAEIIEFLR